MGSALPGFAGASASAAPVGPIDPGGGCWRYLQNPVADPEAEIDDLDGILNLSTSLEPWGVDPRMTLQTAGDTAVGGDRTFSLTNTTGPAVLPLLASRKGTAHYYFDVLDADSKRTALDPVAVKFEIEAGKDAVPPTQVDGTFPITTAGTSALILRTVFFDLGGERMVCNGQTEVDLVGGINPATTPQDTAMLASLTTVAAQRLAVTRVGGQDVLNAARPGDEVETSLSGFASETQVPLALCGTTCGPSVDATTLADGSGLKTLVVPADAGTGAGTVRARAKLGKADIVLDQPMRVLAAPTVELRDTPGKNRIRVVGAEWDPLRQVSVIAVDDSGTRVGSTVRIAAAETGVIDTKLTVPADAEVAGVVATQEHRGTTLKATVEVPAAGAGGDSDAGEGSGTGAGTDSDAGAGTGSGTTGVSPSDAAPVDIPAPIDLPVTTVADPQAEAAAAAAAAELAVTKVSLAGSTRFGDLMGGGPDRVLKLRVENVGTTEVVAPGLSIAVGKGEKIDPVYSSDGFARLAPGKSLTLQIPIALPAGAFGVYTISGQVGEGSSGAFSTTWETYPWGLFVLNALGVLLIAFAVRRRIFAPAPSRIASLAGPPPAAGASPGDGAAVIDLAVLERWWALQADGENVSVNASADMTADAVVDVDAVERWLERCSARQAQGDQNSVKSTS